MSLKEKRNEILFNKQKVEIEQLMFLHRKQHIDLYFADESHFGLTPNVCYAWQEKGKSIKLPAAKGKKLSVFGLLSPECKLFARIFEGTTNSDLIIEALDSFVTTITKQTVVILDNAPIHKSKKFMEKIKQWKEQDLLIYFLPPYSPELNRIEILWRFIKYRWLPFDAYLNFENLKEQLDKVLGKIGSEYFIEFK